MAAGRRLCGASGGAVAAMEGSAWARFSIGRAADLDTGGMAGDWGLPSGSRRLRMGLPVAGARQFSSGGGGFGGGADPGDEGACARSLDGRLARQPVAAPSRPRSGPFGGPFWSGRAWLGSGCDAYGGRRCGQCGRLWRQRRAHCSAAMGASRAISSSAGPMCLDCSSGCVRSVTPAAVEVVPSRVAADTAAPRSQLLPLGPIGPSSNSMVRRQC